MRWLKVAAEAASGKDGPLPALLLLLTVVTGVVDAVSYLRLGHVFVANMTGNFAFLGFAVADAREFSVGGTLIAMGAFSLGALLGGRLGTLCGRHRARYLARAIALELLAFSVVFLVALLQGTPQGDVVRYEYVVPLALAMGLQNATARRLGVPDLTTTVLTLTLTGIAADSPWAGGQGPRPVRRLMAMAMMTLGAALGTFVIFRFGLAPALGLALFLLLVCGVAAHRLSMSAAPWTQGS